MISPFLIVALLVAPLAGGLALVLIPRLSAVEIRAFTLVASLATLVFAGILAAQYDWAHSSQMQFEWWVPWVESFGLKFSFGLMDSISLWLVLLTAFLVPVVVLGSWSAVAERVREFHAWLLFLEAAMLGTFVATDLIFFYVCFEFTLVPLYFLIGIFGSEERLKAARVFFLYTFTASMLTFAGVLYVAYFNANLPATLGLPAAGRWTFSIPDLIQAGQRMSPSQQTWVFLALLAGFAVKVPLWPWHTWLPLAHTEAPTAGSVILAGVLLKLGTYGLLRLAIPMTPLAAAQWAPIVGGLALVGILWAALVCWVQRDVKKLVAYSSVSHLGFCVLGMFALNVIGGTGSVLYMINHGLSTGALFLCVGMIYERLHSRDMDQMSGLGRAMPVWASFFVFFALASVGLPGLNGFVSEFLCLLGTFRAVEAYGRGAVVGAHVMAAAAGLGMIGSAIYILYMVGRVVFGPLRLVVFPEESKLAMGMSLESAAVPTVPRGDLSAREILTLAPIALACLWLGLFPAPVLKSLEKPVARITAAAVTEAQKLSIDRLTVGVADVEHMVAAENGRISASEHAGRGIFRKTAGTLLNEAPEAAAEGQGGWRISSGGGRVDSRMNP